MQVRSRNCAAVLWQLGQHVAGQVGADQLGPTAEILDRPLPVDGAAAGGGQVEQLQAGGPTAGAPGQRRRRFGGQRLPEDRDEQLLHLPRAEPQVVAGDLLQLAGNPQPGDVHLRLPARTDQHPQGVRPQFDELLQDALRRRTGDLVQVVQDQDRAVARPSPPATSSRALMVGSGSSIPRQSRSARPRWATSVASAVSSPVTRYQATGTVGLPRPLSPAAWSFPTRAARPPDRAGWWSCPAVAPPAVCGPGRPAPVAAASRSG